MPLMSFTDVRCDLIMKSVWLCVRELTDLDSMHELVQRNSGSSVVCCELLCNVLVSVCKCFTIFNLKFINANRPVYRKLHISICFSYYVYIIIF